MNTETYSRREKMLRLREELLAVEEDRIAGRSGCTLDELDAYLDNAIEEYTAEQISQGFCSELVSCALSGQR